MYIYGISESLVGDVPINSHYAECYWKDKPHNHFFFFFNCDYCCYNY